MNIIICDDNLLHLEHAHSLTEQHLAAQMPRIIDCTSIKDVIVLTGSENFAPDIAILDVELNDGSGIHLAKILNAKFPKCQIIFLSAFPSYASDVYQVSHVWFVLKNRISEYLPQALEKILLSRNMDTQPFQITIRQNHTSQRLDVDQIYCIERIGHQSRLLTVKGIILVWQTPAELLDDLPDNTFIRCHQSYWVNAQKITAYANNSFYLTDATAVPVSRTYKKAAIELFQAGQASALVI